MTLLIDYLEEASACLAEKSSRVQKLDSQYKKVFDRDIRREMGIVKREIRKKRAEVLNTLLLNLEEFNYLKKYFPDLLAVFMEDEYVGKILSKKSWLLDFRQVAPKEAAAKLEQLAKWRNQLKDAKKFIKKWVGKVEAKPFIATYPVLRGHLLKDMEKSDAIHIIDNVEKGLKKEGWLLLITDSLIKIPINKFITKISKFKYEELVAHNDFKRTMGRGTVSETAALRKLEKIKSRKEHYENILTQILLANPSYLRKLKRGGNWLSKNRSSALEKFAERIVPRTVKERSWLNEMEKRLKPENDK
ncbi:hypothetical protein KKF81_05795 [Candidatus Micrarchaeota archaeon]|nr:hypothetical protein [Candidatus Micrarchaeota archaeon]MBU1166442.1 hypothetical protein [Candidatus Micrarchaeota archaeon]MBU1886551.1 hypothetical protein [Candidatus Micrarchaeota archaeon]